MQKLLLLAAWLLFSVCANAQLYPTCPPGQKPPDKCEDACVYCDINGYIGTTVGYTGTHTIACGTIYLDNDQWLGFVAGDTMADFTVTNFACVKGDGLQIALYEKTCENEYSPIDCHAGQQGGEYVPVDMTNVPLIPGTVYFLLIDGWSGDKCTFQVTVDPPSAVIANPLGTSIGPIQGPDTICPGATVTYSVPGVTNAGTYTWSVPAGWLINGQPSPQLINAADGGASVKVKVGSNGGDICVEAANSCFPDGPSICKPVAVEPLPINVLPTAYVCNEDKPYLLPWGAPVSNNGTYQKTLKSFFGCDSTVRQKVVFRAPLVTNLPVQTICAGESLNMCGTPYTNAGSYSLMCQSPEGCDSLVNFSVAVLAPIAQIQGVNRLTCSTASTMLTAAASPAGTQFQWKNDAGLDVGADPQLLVSTPGTYFLSATLQGGGIQCVKTDSIVVVSDTISPNISTMGGTLNCSVSSLEMQVSTNAHTPSWSWSGPGAFSAIIPNAVASQAGTYVVTVTDALNGCTASATTIVESDLTLPVLSTTGAILTCSNPTAQISANSLPAAVTYQWTGPNSFLSVEQSPLIQTAGVYTVTATNPVNQCSSTQTTVVSLDNTPPGAITSAAGDISCANPGIQISGEPWTNGNTFSWTGPNGFSSTDQNPMAVLAGAYTLVVTGTNGCTSESTVQVTGDTVAPDVAAVGDTVSCGAPSTTLSGNSASPDASFSWVGPNGFLSNLQNPIGSDTGIYILTVTGLNFCTATASAIIAGDFVRPDVGASSDTLTCAQTTVFVAGNSVTPGTTFLWNGPGSFSSPLNPAPVNADGLYTLTATAPNGCTAETTVNVPLDIAEPGATAQGGTLTCGLPTLNLSGGAGIANVQWSWTGPGGFSSDQQNPAVQVPGQYLLEVTSLANGCHSSAGVTVEQDVEAPIISSKTGILTCTLDTLDLNGQANVPSAFTWNGPGGFVFSGANAQVTAPGDYTLIAVALGNGCADTMVVAVAQDITLPDVGALGGTLDCNTALISLTGSSATGGAAFLWTGPQNFTANIPNPEVASAGLYVLNVTGPNGCQDTASAWVLQNTEAPAVSLAGADTLTCVVTEITLFSNIETAGATGVWTGPDNFTANTADISIGTPGDYVFTVTAPNGCKSSPALSVLQDIDPPQVLNTQGGLLNCSVQSLALHAESALGNAYSWSGPGNFSSAEQNPLVTNPGDYLVTVTDPINGCTSTATALVTQDIIEPDIAVQSDSLNCYTTSVVLDASSNTPGITFNWTGPNNFNATAEDPTAIAPGPYLLTVTAPNGCTAAFQHTVGQDVAVPDVSASGDTLSCSFPQGNITGQSTTSAASYSWSGPGNFNSNQASASVSEAGLYTLVVTGGNGCTSSAQATVVADLTAPTTTATGGIITCLDSSVTLSAVANTSVVWQWSGPGNFSSTLQQPDVSAPGNYLLTATAANGCKDTTSALVEDHTQTPDVDVNTPDDLDCTTTEVTLQAVVSGSGVYTYQWVTNNGAILNGAGTPMPVVTQAGLYTILVTDTVNGCTSTQDVEVLTDPEMPTGAILAKRNISCFGETDGSVKISSMLGGTPPFLYALDDQGFSPVDHYTGLTAGTHTLQVTDAKGCTYETSFVIEELAALSIDLGPDTTIHLGQSIEISLDGSINFPDRVVETNITPQDLVLPGTLIPTQTLQYQVEIVDSSGCRTQDSRTIRVDRERWVYIPNAFNPDSDNNNVLTVFGGEDVQEIKVFRIFDRWGNNLFERRAFQANDDANGWDGRYKGAMMNPAVFVYYVEILFVDGKTELYKGDVTLLR